MERQELHITGQVQLIRGKAERVATKTEASKRTLPIPDVLLPVIVAVLSEQPDSILLFPSEKGTPILPRNLVRQFKERLTKAGLPTTIRLHVLRHVAAMAWLSNGAGILTTPEDERITEPEGPVAQWIEHQSSELGVGGSSPSWVTSIRTR